jgi:hypothetical protein
LAQRINKVRLYRPASVEPDAYRRLAPALTRPIRWDIVAEQSDQITQVRNGDPGRYGLDRGDPASVHSGQHDPPHLPGDD